MSYCFVWKMNVRGNFIWNTPGTIKYPYFDLITWPTLKMVKRFQTGKTDGLNRKRVLFISLFLGNIWVCD